MKLRFHRWHEAFYPGYRPSRFAFIHWLGIRLRIGRWHYVITWWGGFWL